MRFVSNESSSHMRHCYVPLISLIVTIIVYELDVHFVDYCQRYVTITTMTTQEKRKILPKCIDVSFYVDWFVTFGIHRHERYERLDVVRIRERKKKGKRKKVIQKYKLRCCVSLLLLSLSLFSFFVRFYLNTINNMHDVEHSFILLIT
jgi:hypothetical protein